MRKITCLMLLLISVEAFSQTKPMRFFNENGEKISKEKFIKLKDYTNRDLYFENDSIQYGLLVTKRKFGQLDQKTLNKLKTYLTELSQTPIDSAQYMVINYISYPLGEEYSKPRSTWNVLDRNYVRKLHKIADIKQFWMYAPDLKNLKFYYKNRIDWIADKEQLLKKLFFPYKIKHGNYLLIKPNGQFFYHLGEHSKYQIWENAEKYFK